MVNNQSGGNNRRRGAAPQVVVVKKKRFGVAASEVKKEQPAVNPAAAKPADTEQPKTSFVKKTDANFKFTRDSNNQIKNLDTDKAYKPAQPKEDPAKKKKEEVQKPVNKYSKEDQEFNEKLAQLSKKTEQKPNIAKKDTKDFLSDLTIVSHAKEKKYNKTDESSLFLNNKAKYDADKAKAPNFYDDENEERERLRSIASMKRAREKNKKGTLFGGDSAGSAQEKKIREIIIPETITIQELANRMAVRSADVVKELMKMGMMITASKPIDADTAELLVEEFGHTPKRVLDSDVEKILELPDLNDPAKLKSRAPVVSVMGHVDHGKTSLLDALRETDIVATESGGITQHIGASKVQIDKKDNKNFVTFLDTPGHEAFTAMRLRGANATDMVILVVAADDGVKDQTIEAINHSKAAGIPIIVAVNKIDKEGADPQKVLTELLSHEVVVEDMGGEALAVQVSAKQKLNLDKLIDAVKLQSEILELKANHDCPARGIVIESKVDKAKGVLTSLLVQNGKLRVGDIVLAGTAFGKVRKMTNEHRRKLDVLAPAEPAEILGLDFAPEAGEKFYVVESEKIARDLIEYRQNKKRDIEAAKRSKKTLEDIFSGMTADQKKKLSLIIKADVKGSVEAIATSLEKLANDEVSIEIIHSAVGGITESDLVLARASEAIILSFNVRLAGNVADAEIKDVDIRYYSIIYDLIDDVKAAVKGMLKPIIRTTELGKGEIRQVFNLSKFGKVAGSYVNSGVVKKSGKCRIIRDSVVLAESAIKALKHFKDDVKEVVNGSECGISFENFTDFQDGDQLEFFEEVEEAR